MSEGPNPTGATPVEAQPAVHGEGNAGTGPEPNAQTRRRTQKRPAAASGSDASGRRVVLLLALIIVVGLPVGVGLATYLTPTAAPAEAPEASVAELTSVSPSLGGLAADVSGPRWVRPSWANDFPDVTAFELAAGTDVLFANGRHRPVLGISCVDGRTDVHVTTGGTAPIDPETSGHVVSLTFNDQPARPQLWVAADDQRSLFAPDALRLAGQMASARRMTFGFTHYMSGAVDVEFDMRGANDVLTSMADPCGWGD